MTFKVGDTITGRPGNGYEDQNNVICEVVQLRPSGCLKVKIISYHIKSKVGTLQFGNPADFIFYGVMTNREYLQQLKREVI